MSDVSGFLTSEQKPERPSVSRRFGEVLAVTAAGKADIELAVSGITIPGVPCMGSYVPLAGDSVVVDFTDDAPLVLGVTPGDPWHVVGAAGEPAFQSSWTAFSWTTAVPRFRKVNGVVFVDGMAAHVGNSATTIFTLPAGYRPSGTATEGSIFIVAANNGGEITARLNVFGNGNVTLSTAASAYVALDAVRFIAEQ